MSLASTTFCELSVIEAVQCPPNLVCLRWCFATAWFSMVSRLATGDKLPLPQASCRFVFVIEVNFLRAPVGFQLRHRVTLHDALPLEIRPAICSVGSNGLLARPHVGRAAK